jgi:prepilin signal peptidase PulO-like enzyme (type II secretory pathway)
LSQRRLTQNEIRFLQEALSTDYKATNIRLREGEYQYDLAKAIALFQLELYFPDVKDITRKLFGEEKTNDTQFIRKVQTILKKMEKSSIVKILPKKNPWELQRYALLSFKFQDVDKNVVILATEEQVEQAREMLSAALNQGAVSAAEMRGVFFRARIVFLALIVVASYTASLWTLVQPTINPIIFILALALGLVCSLLLGDALSKL